MSANYAERKAAVVGALLKTEVSNVNLIDVAEAVLDALDHIPENVR